MLRFCAAVTGTLQERTALPSRITVHAPHWPSPQPNLGPCSSRSSRKTYKSGVVGSVSTTRDWLFTRSEIRAMRVSFLDFFDTRKLDSASPLVAFARVAVARVEKVLGATGPSRSAKQLPDSLQLLAQAGRKKLPGYPAAKRPHSALESSWPLAKTILSRCMMGLPSLARLPTAVISSPGFRVSLLHPALVSIPMAPSSMLHFSTAPFSSFASR